ncbi:MAG: hypothetical protein U0U70_08555 [Chitinophagaceae bacterium]
MKKCLLFLLLASSVLSVTAQPFSLDERVKPTELTLVEYKKDDSLRRGRINVTGVTQVHDTAYYFVQGLSMYSPAYFGITAKSGSPNIKVNLCKNNWHTMDRTGGTADSAHWEVRFKTEGDFGIMVIPQEKPAEYTLCVWTGDEAKEVGISSPFKGSGDNAGKTEKAKGGGFLKNNLLYIIIGVLVIAVALLAFKLKKKQS